MNRIHPNNPEKNGRNLVCTCTHRHAYHMMAPRGWMNDPNGFVFFQGQYHLFYQHYPDAPRWGLMHWGHCVSDDLVCWRHLPIALAPDCVYDGNGCFSGSSIVHNAKLYVFYTGNAADGRQTQCMAVSADGVHFQKHPGNPVIAAPPDHIKPRQFRDPCVFRRHGRFYMIVGAEGKNHHGQALVYTSDNLLDWVYRQSITAGEKTMGYMWECPTIFFWEDQAVLLLSPQGMTDHPAFDNSGDTGYFVGRLGAGTAAYTHGAFHKLDNGFDFYAAQAMQDATGRCLLAAWMSTWSTPTPTETCEWAGSMILPREMQLQNGLLRFQPVREIQRYQSLITTLTDVRSSNLLPIQGRVCRLSILSENDDFSLRLFCSPDEQEYTALHYDARRHSLCLDLSRSGKATRGTRCLSLPDEQDTIRLDLFLDRSSLEIFVNGGTNVITARVFPGPLSDEIRFDGKAVFRKLSLWEIRVPKV